MVYCYKCPKGHRFSAATRGIEACPECGVLPRRDYPAENFGLGSGVRASRDGTARDQARLFLPSNSDFAGPDDPEGRKGLTKFYEESQPKAGNKHPVRPGDVNRKVW